MPMEKKIKQEGEEIKAFILIYKMNSMERREHDIVDQLLLLL